MDVPRLDGAGDILVVDDAPENLVAIKAALDGVENELVFARSGEEALRFLLERDFALILLDVQMPSMDGFETARVIRERQRCRHVPIIFVTAHDYNSDEVLGAYRLGAVDFLFKPISSDVLRAKAAVFVELQRRTAEVTRQAVLLKEHEREMHERALADQRRRLEAKALRQSLTEQKKHAEELTRKNAELENIRAELESSNQRLAEDDRRKDEFLAVLAHELRNPLAALVSGVDLMTSRPGSGAEGDTVPAAMRRQCKHLIRLVDDLLDISRVTSGKFKLRKKRVLVSRILDDAVELATGTGVDTRHDLAVHCECDGAALDGDPVRLAQMVANLLSNAMRYTPVGGHIELSARRTGDGQVAIRVTDDGCGLRPELVARVFEPFVQENDDGDGLGIGLALVRRLAHMHGGTVTAHSDGVDQGSEFEIRLPEAADADAESLPHVLPPEAVAKPSNGTALRVALVDDNGDVREMTRCVLERWGYTVVEAASGEDGISLVIGDPPDVAVIDIGLPDVDGYEVARRLREHLGDGCPRLVAMTGYSQPKDRDRAREAGFDAHVAKPADANTLRAVMRAEPRPGTNGE